MAAGDGDGIAAAHGRKAAGEIETQEDLWADSDYRKQLIRSLGAEVTDHGVRASGRLRAERGVPAMSTTTIKVTINGEVFEETVPVRMLLVDFIRERAALTGTHIGCTYEGVCGACTVQLDGEAVKSCLMVAAQADGHEITTVEGLTQGGELSPLAAGLQRAARAAVRFLHARHPDEHGRVPAREPGPDGRGDPPRAGGQPLPLYWLCAHRRCGPSRPRRRPGEGGEGR